MAKRIFRSVVVTALMAVILTAALIVPSLYHVYEVSLTDEMRKEAAYLVHSLDIHDDNILYFQDFTSENRVTLINNDGTVLYDSAADEMEMENHRSRPEVTEAFANGSGKSMRYSDTLSDMTIYYALKTEAGNVLRISSTRSSMLGVFLEILPQILVMLLCVVLISLIIARFSAKRIVRPINELDLDDPIKNDVYSEIAPLVTRMEFQHIEIQRQMSALERARTQLATIIASMREGLILMDSRNTVLSINRSAAEILEADIEACTGKIFTDIYHNEPITELVARANNGEHGDMLLTKDKRTYRLYVSPVIQRSRIHGVVMLLLDITERYNAEASRREFTANVSHELKTPLTSISGYAEIIRDGIALPEDIPQFAGRIFNDSKRLIALVNDILELSRLDERQGFDNTAPVQITEVIREVVQEFSGMACEKELTLTLEGSSETIEGHSTLLHELFHNLIENAVKYTPAGGKVTVSVSGDASCVTCRVADTGIGIPKEHHSRIFERFYRVDKSHSRATGGTGLGLAIVKHAAEIHNASLELESEENKGTAVTVRFPR